MAYHFANTTKGDEAADILIGCLKGLDELREFVASAVAMRLGRSCEGSSILQGFNAAHDALKAELRKLAAEVTGDGLRSIDGGHHVPISGIHYR